MRVKCEMALEDVELIHIHMNYFKGLFPKFEIISRSLSYEPEDTEWEGDPCDFFEVEFEIGTMNHFWTLAKCIGEIKYKNKTIYGE